MADRAEGAPTMLTRYARNATGSLGIVVPGECYAEIFSPIVKELKRVAERNGWRVLFRQVRDTGPSAGLRHRAVTRAFDLRSRRHRQHRGGIIGWTVPHQERGEEGLLPPAH